MYSTVKGNLDCLLEIIRFNILHEIKFFRISSDLIPFASHKICTFPWQHVFEGTFRSIGRILNETGMRVSMHPDQFVLINSIDEDIFKRSVQELEYHAEVLDLLGTGLDAKIQIHVGGVYGEQEKSIERFTKRYASLSVQVKRRLVIENDERLYDAATVLPSVN